MEKIKTNVANGLNKKLKKTNVLKLNLTQCYYFFFWKKS